MIKNGLLIILICILFFGCKSDESDKSIKSEAQDDKYADGTFFPDKNEYLLFTNNFEDVLQYPDLETLTITGWVGGGDLSFLEFFPRLKALSVLR
jgi:hypothetical protein